MKFVDEFRDPEIISRTADEIRRLAGDKRHYRFMEVCGGHTHAIYRFGLKDLLPENIELVHGPGCPVCVLPMGRIDDGLSMCLQPDVIFTAFGDMMRVPGAKGTPLEYKARGADVRIVYSPLDALKIARNNPDKHVMFFAIGFETTQRPRQRSRWCARRPNDVQKFFRILQIMSPSSPRCAPFSIRPILRIDAFIGPGARVYCDPAVDATYEWISKDERKPVVCSGFEPLDILQSIVMLLRQMQEGRSIVENQYKRVVPWEGNRAALRAMAEVFELRPYFEWRGLGFISQSALRLRAGYREWDAEHRFHVPGIRVTDPKAAQCGEVLKGVLRPNQCKLFGRECTPEHPVGALMVSSEGSCAAHHNYEFLKSQMVTGIHAAV